jgi:hypothetical protein
LSPSEAVVAKAVSAVSATSARATVTDGGVSAVRDQSPVAGAPSVVRSATTAERLEEPPSLEAKSYAKSTKSDVVQSLVSMTLPIDVAVPGIFVGDPSKPDGPSQRAPKQLSELRATPALMDKILNEPDFANADESQNFSTGVALLEHTVAALRSVEAALQDYRQAIDKCHQTATAITRALVSAAARLRQIDDGVAGARADLATATRLRAEEQARIDGINARRDGVVRERVTYYVFHRPRALDLVQAPPVRAVDPASIDSVVPDCLLNPGAVPPELLAMLDVVKEAPTSWFSFGRDLYLGLDRLETMFHAAAGAKSRAGVTPSLLALKQPALEGIYGGWVNQAFAAQQQAVTAIRQSVAVLDLGTLSATTWNGWFAQLHGAISLGDLIDGAHGRPDVVRSAAKRMDEIRSLASCIYERFSQVPARTRLAWAELVGENDVSRSLRDLGVLPAFGDLPHDDRVALQSLVDVLFDHFVATPAQSLALANDLVRVALLLACHAPVGKIVAGEMRDAAKMQVGSRIALSVTAGAVRVGMPVQVYESTGRVIVAQAMVEDLDAGVARARLVSSRDPEVTLPAGSRVHFAESNLPLRFRTELAT